MLTLLVAMAAATAQPAEKPSDAREVIDRGGKIVSQPARDVGVAKTRIPVVLQRAQDNPYDLTGLRTCARIKAATDDLTVALGPDFVVGNNRKENKAGRLAEAGGRTIVNTIIPFRGLIREISGAAPAQRRLNDAVDAGFARRGFLRGVALARRCPGSAD